MLQECIKDLIEDLHQFEINFEKSKNGYLFNFIQDVQPFTTVVDQHIEMLEKYKQNLVELPLMNDKKLTLMILHIRELSVECFFSKTSKKLFIDKYKAVQHDLHYIERALK